MDIKPVCLSHHKHRTSCFSAFHATSDRSSDLLSPSRAYDDIDMASSCSDNDVDTDIDAPVIRIPTGLNGPKKSTSVDISEDSETIPVPVSADLHQDERGDVSGVLQPADVDDADFDAIVCVRRPRTCPCGTEVKDSMTMTPVAEIMHDGLDITEAQVEAVPLHQHFYNQ